MAHIQRGTRKASLETLLTLSDALGESLDGTVRGVPMEDCRESDSDKVRVLNAMMRVLYEHAGEWVWEMEAEPEE